MPMGVVKLPQLEILLYPFSLNHSTRKCYNRPDLSHSGSYLISLISFQRHFQSTSATISETLKCSKALKIYYSCLQNYTKITLCWIASMRSKIPLNQHEIKNTIEMTRWWLKIVQKLQDSNPPFSPHHFHLHWIQLHRLSLQKSVEVCCTSHGTQ